MYNSVHANYQKEQFPQSAMLPSTRRPTWRPQITNASTHEEVIAALRMFGLDSIADRLGYLRSLVHDDPDEPVIEIESLRAMALFIMSERQLPLPRIAVSPDGLIQIEWRPEDSGILAMKFLLDGKIQFAGIGEKAQEGVDRVRISGTLEKDDMMRALHLFVSRLGSE